MAGQESNPFAALLQPISNTEEKPRKKETSSKLLQKLLMISSPESPGEDTYVHLDSIGEINSDSLSSVLFERLLVEKPKTLIKRPYSKPGAEVAGEERVVYYLHNVYNRCMMHTQSNDKVMVQQVKSTVIINLVTIIEEPAIYEGQDPHQQLQKLILEEFSAAKSSQPMLKDLVQSLQEQSIPVPSLFDKVLDNVGKALGLCTVQSTNWNMVEIINFYASSTYLTPVLLKIPTSAPGISVTGRSFQRTAFGSLLGLSCISGNSGVSELFPNPLETTTADHRATENAIRMTMKTLQQSIAKTFLLLLKGRDSKMQGLLLNWVELCLKHNIGRSGLWHLQAAEFELPSEASDGFMLNLAAVLLELSMPIVAGVQDKRAVHGCKIFRIDPTYCSPASREAMVPGLYPEEFYKATCLLPTPEETNADELVLPEKYTFSTTCFFFTHRALQLSFQVINEKLKKLSQELNMLQRQLTSSNDGNVRALEALRSHMKRPTSRYLTYMAAAFEPTFIENLLEFISATAMWITQVAFKPQNSPSTPTPYDELTVKKLSADSSAALHPYLKFIPEFLVETFVTSISSINRCAPETLNLCSDGTLHHYITFIAAFMGSPHLINNPHLRAQMCECLDALLVKQPASKGIIGNYRDQMYLDHPLSLHLVTAVIHVFVSIEMTGSTVAFEEKFSYRRPMYDVMQYLWEIETHKKEFVALANHALATMEAASPPLFLRFVNLLINDAIFLLDEGLSYMTQIREQEIERDQGVWVSLPAAEQTERSNNFEQMKRLAQFHNALGTCTIQTLLRLTKDIPKMFTHNTLVDRMAAMLNHFLDILVGPKQYKLKVKDMDKYEFRPGEVVENICTIYKHLIDEQSFGIAVSNDGRSYNAELFGHASRVLSRIGKILLADQIQAAGKKIESLSQKNQDLDHLAASAPERFLDPIMLHLMVDPVLLPSSNVVIDRPTIARHLLSDQSDPFNRQPLTMEEIVSDEVLRKEIDLWVQEQMKNISHSQL